MNDDVERLIDECVRHMESAVRSGDIVHDDTEPRAHGVVPSSSYAWTRWLAVALEVEDKSYFEHELCDAILDLARAEYVRGQVEMRERAVRALNGADFFRRYVRALEPEGGG